MSISIFVWKLHNCQKPDYNRPFLNDDTSQSVINKLGNVYEETIEITKSFLDIKTIDQIQSILSKKKMIDLQKCEGDEK